MIDNIRPSGRLNTTTVDWATGVKNIIPAVAATGADWEVRDCSVEENLMNNAWQVMD